MCEAQALLALPNSREINSDVGTRTGGGEGGVGRLDVRFVVAVQYVVHMAVRRPTQTTVWVAGDAAVTQVPSGCSLLPLNRDDLTILAECHLFISSFGRICRQGYRYITFNINTEYIKVLLEEKFFSDFGGICRSSGHISDLICEPLLPHQLS